MCSAALSAAVLALQTAALIVHPLAFFVEANQFPISFLDVLLLDHRPKSQSLETDPLVAVSVVAVAQLAAACSALRQRLLTRHQSSFAGIGSAVPNLGQRLARLLGKLRKRLCLAATRLPRIQFPSAQLHRKPLRAPSSCHHRTIAHESNKLVSLLAT